MFRKDTLSPCSALNLSHRVPPTIQFQSLQSVRGARITVNVSDPAYDSSQIHRRIILAVSRNLEVRYSSVTQLLGGTAKIIYKISGG